MLCFLYTGHVIILYSNINDTATKTKYNRNIVRPRPLFIRQRKHAIDNTTNNSIINNIVIEHTIPTEFTSTGCWYIIPYKSHGIGNLKKRKDIRSSEYTSII